MTMRKKLTFLQSLIVSAVISAALTLGYFSYTTYTLRQRDIEWIAVQAVLEDIQDSIKTKKAVPASWQDVEAILSRASRSQLLIARRYVRINFTVSQSLQGRFIAAINTEGSGDAMVRAARIEWLGDEISKEIDLLRRPSMP